MQKQLHCQKGQMAQSGTMHLGWPWTLCFAHYNSYGVTKEFILSTARYFRMLNKRIMNSKFHQNFLLIIRPSRLYTICVLLCKNFCVCDNNKCKRGFEHKLTLVSIDEHSLGQLKKCIKIIREKGGRAGGIRNKHLETKKVVFLSHHRAL